MFRSALRRFVRDPISANKLTCVGGGSASVFHCPSKETIA